MKPFSHLKGYTMMELIIVIIVLGVLSAASMQLIFQGYQAYSSGKDASDANWQGALAFARMSREIHLIRSPNDINTSSNANTLSFTDITGTAITYSLSGSTLQRAEGASAAQALIDGVSSITFSYYNAAGSTVSPPLTSTTAATIRYIQIALVILKNNMTYNLQTTINARNVL